MSVTMALIKLPVWLNNFVWPPFNSVPVKKKGAGGRGGGGLK